MGFKFDYMVINTILEHILSVICIMPKENYFGDMFLQLGFYLSRGSYIYSSSKVPTGVEVLLLGCSFLNRISNLIMLQKVVGKSDKMVQGV